MRVSRPDADPILSPNTWAGAGRLLLMSAVFWGVAAVLLHQVVPGADSLPRLLALTESAGLTITLAVLLLKSSSPLWRLRPLARGVLLVMAALAGGTIAGHVVAILLAGEPMRLAGPGTAGWVPLVVATLVAGLGLHYFATREQLSSEAAARSEAQRLAAEAHLRLLHAQLEPHMLFNTLANLRSLVRDDPAAAERMIDQLITYLRSSLLASRTPWSTLGAEFAQLRAYLEIMAVRLGPRMTWRLELPQPLEHVPVAPMLLQPLVENAIKHGLEPMVGAGSIEVVARETPDGIEVAVKDSGQGLPAALDDAAGKQAAHYGLQHVRERLAALYGSDASLTLRADAPAGVCAMVSFPAGPHP